MTSPVPSRAAAPSRPPGSALSMAPLLGVMLLALPLVGFARSLWLGEPSPALLPVLASLIQGTALIALRRGPSRALGTARIGFHLGMAAFFLSYPILSPSTAAPDVPAPVRDTADLALLLTILGFELAYGSFGTIRMRGEQSPISLSPRIVRGLMILEFIGLGAWFLTVLDYALSWQVPVFSVLLTMRGRIEGAVDDAATFLGYGQFLLGSGIFLASAASAILLCSGWKMPRGRQLIAWAILGACAAVGFLRGSRALFLYSVVPLGVTLWTVIAPRARSLARSTVVTAGVTCVVLAWGAMSAMRGADVRDYEGGWEEMTPAYHVEGAFNVYAALVEVIEAFPRTFPYEHGRSLVPLILGWVPRPLWPDKPYPFSLFATYIRGQTLEHRDASIAVGLTGEGYGNFGLAGAFLWGALLGAACAGGDGAVARARTLPALRLQLAGINAVWAAMIVRGGVPEMFYMGLGVAVGPLVLAYFVSRWTRRLGWVEIR